MENIVIVNPEKLERIKSAIKEGGPDKLHILSDFDRTLTKAYAGAEYIPSLNYILYDKLTSDYAIESKKLHNKYYPIEQDPKIPLQEKKMAMKDWWDTHFDQLIARGLSKKEIEKVAGSKKVIVRKGFAEFTGFLKSRNIPLVIISASGIGGDTIPLIFKRESSWNDNIFIISNAFNWDKNRKAVSVKKPVVYGLHKNETLAHQLPGVFEKIKNRKNIILIGDSLDDVDMSTGFDYDNIVKIGFLNDRVGEKIEAYKKTFDIVILNDGTMDYINELLKELIK